MREERLKQRQLEENNINFELDEKIIVKKKKRGGKMKLFLI